MYGDKKQIENLKAELRELNLLAAKMKRERASILDRMEVNNRIGEIELTLEKYPT